MPYLFFDTETTGVPAGGDNVHMVQLAWILADDNHEVRAHGDFIVKPEGWRIDDASPAVKIHGFQYLILAHRGLNRKGP